MKTDYRIGAQILSPDMIRCSFQHTEAVLDTISSIRSTAANVHDGYCRKLREKPNEALMETRGYTNAISILGSRGSGKTSIILTLQHILRVGYEQWEKDWRVETPLDTDEINIMMPVLVPQDFSDKQPLLSWIISQLQHLAESVLKEIENGSNQYWCAQPLRDWVPNTNSPTFSNPLADAIEKLTNSFELRYKNEYGALLRDEDQIYHYMDSVERDSNLMLDMLKLISMLIEYYKYRHGKDLNKEPLLFFVIDDLDMAPQRSNEVLNLLLRYLQHPNVVVLCGWNQELFQNHLCIELLKTQGVLSGMPNENFGFDDVFMNRQRKRVTAMDSARRLAIDNLKKAFPPAQRFEIRGLTTKQRADFPLLSAVDGKDPKTFFELIEETIAEFTRRRTGKDPERKSFLYNKGEAIYAYMRIFDNKSRGMINECRAFDELWKRVHNWDKEKEDLDLTNALHELLNTILFSTTRFAPFRRGLRDLITIKKVNLSKNGSEFDYFCNYKGVDDAIFMYEKRKVEWEIKETVAPEYKLELEFCYFPSVIIDVYLLLDFVENLIRSIVGVPPVQHHTSRAFSKALNEQNSPLEVGTDEKHPTLHALASAGIHTIPFFPDTSSLRLCILLLDSYEKEGFTDGQYFFSGTNTFCRLINAVLGLCFKGKNYILPELTTIYTEESRAWFETIQKIPFALEASEENIKRSAIYQNYLAQNIYTDTAELLRAIQPDSALHFDQIISSIPKENKTVVDDDMKELLFCLRETDKLRRTLSNALTEYSRKKTSNLTQNLSLSMAEAQLFLNHFDKTIKKGPDGWIDTRAYKRNINRFMAAPRDWQSITEFDESLIRRGRQLADNRVEKLLEDLRERLTYSLVHNYQKQTDLKSQYGYLRHAAFVIKEYIREWELMDAGWTQEESEAAAMLQGIFFANAMDTPFFLTKRLAEYGPELAYGKRDMYKSTLGDLKTWVSQRLEQFKERKQIERAMSTLSKAPEHIRRSLIIDDRLFELLKELGSLIATGQGERAYDIWTMKQNDPKAWAAPVVWSVEGDNLAIVDDWCKKLRAAGWINRDSEEQVEQKSQSATKFDLAYLL